MSKNCFSSTPRCFLKGGSLLISCKGNPPWVEVIAVRRDSSPGTCLIVGLMEREFIDHSVKMKLIYQNNFMNTNKTRSLRSEYTG